MAIAPLFLEDMTTLLGRLRLSAVTGGDALNIVGDAVMQVRVNVYARLGVARVDEIVAYGSEEDPEDHDEVMRSIAEVMEVTWVRLLLLDRLPALWMDQSGGDRETFNQEGTFRSLDSPNAQEKLRARLQLQVDEWMAILAGDIALGDAPPVNAWTSDKPDPLPVLGDTPFINQPLGDGEKFIPGDFDGNFIDRVIDGNAEEP